MAFILKKMDQNNSSIIKKIANSFSVNWLTDYLLQQALYAEKNPDNLISVGL